MTQPEAYTTVDGRRCRIITFFDIDGDPTDDTDLAVSMLYQFPEDERPEGVPQTFRQLDFESIRRLPPQ